MLMSSLGVDSPMFDYVEQIAGRPVATVKDKKHKERLDLER
jgi:hypothetical protein